MKGVTLGTYRSTFGIDKTKNDLKNITDAEIHTVYYTNYWLKSRCNQLPSGVDYAVFDAAINSGPRRAAKWLQEAVGVKKDGVIGPQTLKAVRQGDPIELIDEMVDIRLAFMQSLSIWGVFGKGWSRRVTGVRTDAHQMSLWGE